MSKNLIFCLRADEVKHRAENLLLFIKYPIGLIKGKHIIGARLTSFRFDIQMITLTWKLVKRREFIIIYQFIEFVSSNVMASYMARKKVQWHEV